MSRKHKRTVTLLPVWIGIVVATVLWTVMFGTKHNNFWTYMVFATTILGSWAWYNERDLFKPTESFGKTILWGVGSAVLLYGVFWVGDIVTSLFPLQDGMIKNVYSTKEQADKWVIGALLLFPIGPGEEIFWRGLVQKRFVEKWGMMGGIATATLIYSLVHLASINPFLILAALVCGAFWGFLYHYTKSIWICIVSHAVWDFMIFVLIPLR